MSEKDRGNLAAILDSVNKIQAFTSAISNAENFYSDIRTFDATLMNFVIIGESIARLSEEITKANPHIEWQKIKGFRNMIAHDYFGIDAEEVWQIIQQYVPLLKTNIQQIIES
ncbi:MAG: HepT-like ribonuclease domain-containing protein [Bacteroidia bacterium]